MAWTHSPLFRPTGLNPRFTPENLAARLAAPPLLKPTESGLTADRLFSPKITAANGKSFTNVNAVRSGGHGAAIVLLQI